MICVHLLIMSSSCICSSYLIFLCVIFCVEAIELHFPLTHNVRCKVLQIMLIEAAVFPKIFLNLKGYNFEQYCHNDYFFINVLVLSRNKMIYFTSWVCYSSQSKKITPYPVRDVSVPHFKLYIINMSEGDNYSRMLNLINNCLYEVLFVII